MAKHLTYKFTDGSEIDIFDDQTATIIGSTTQFAFLLWQQSKKDNDLKQYWTAIFVRLADAIHKKHGIVLEYTDHFLQKTVNHFNNLMQTAQ
jgi:hypothetical protein